MRVTPLFALALMVSSPAAAQSFTWCQDDSPDRNFFIVSYDADFLFASRHYGDSRDFGGNTEPGFFVHSKAEKRWIRILALSTKDGRFGRSFSSDSAENARFAMVSVVWDFRALAREPFAPLPLRTPGSIVLPDSIVHEPGTDRYALHFMSSWRAVPGVTTTMYVQRSDLVKAFAEVGSSSTQLARCRD